jgi:hypothetical protein
MMIGIARQSIALGGEAYLPLLADLLIESTFLKNLSGLDPLLT